ncbi:TIGR04255 family protein [Arthrobacter terricola]|nr:TIGR04255 family protein [Arthrobacter terricola]
MSDTSAPPAVSDAPLGGLPSADKTLLANAPLEVAICEVRFTAEVGSVPVETAERVRDALAKSLEVDFTSIQPAAQNTMEINLNAVGASWSGEETKGWQIASAQGHHTATVFPGSVIWQVADYERWSISMRRPLELLLGAIASDLFPSLVQRIGLRYVDRFVDSSCVKPQDWEGKIEASLLGPLCNPVFGGLVTSSQQQVDFALDGRHGAVLRHGPIPDPASRSVNYLLDLDVFANASELFKIDDVLGTAEKLNRTALSLFQACVSVDYLKALQGEGTS